MLANALVKPLVAATFTGLVLVHWLSPLDAVTASVGALWVLLVARR